MIYGLLSFLLFYGFCIVCISSRAGNITVATTDIGHLNNLMKIFKATSQCPSDGYTINIIPYNATPPFVSPVGKNDFVDVNLVFGPRQYFSPIYFGFKNGTSVLSLPNQHIDDIFMDYPLRLKLMMQAVNESLSMFKDVNKSVVFVLGGGNLDPMKPWQDFNPMIYLSSFKGSLSVQLYAKAGDENVICNQIVQSRSVLIAMDLSRDGTLAVLKACNDRNLLNWRYRWLVFFSSLSFLNQTTFANLPLRDNFTVIDFSQTKEFNVVDSIQDEQDVVLADISYLVLKMLDFSECSKPPGSNTLSLRTGDYSFTNGVIKRLTWRLDCYRLVGGVFNKQGDATITNDIIKVNLPVLKMFNNDLLAEMKTKVFRIGAMEEFPFVYNQIVNGTVNQTGLCVEMIIYIMRSLGVRYNITFYKLPNGVISTNKTFNGMLEIIQNRKADIIIGPITENPHYRSLVHFTKPFYTYNVAAIYRIPPGETLNKIFEFIEAFEWSVWALVITSCIIYAVALTLVNMISPNQANFGFLYSLLFSMGSMVQGVTTALPDKISGRILVVFWWIFNISVLLTYVANYAAVRTNIRLQAKITQFDDLTLQSRYSYATITDSSIDDYLITSKSPAIETLHRNIDNQYKKLMTTNVDESIKLVRNSSFAFIYSDAALRHFLNETCMTLTSGGQNFNYSFVLSLDSDYVQIINDQLDKINASFITYLRAKYFPNIVSPNCQSNTWIDVIFEKLDYVFLPSINFSLRMNQFAGIFVIMLLGIFISLFMAIIEFTVRKCKRKNPRSKLA